MSHGRIEQLDRTEVLYARPCTRFTAEFLGVKNLLEATVADLEGGIATLRTAGGLVLRAADGGYRPGEAVLVGIRPERMRLDGADEGDNALPGTLDDEIYLGDRTDWRVRLGDGVVTVAEAAAVVRDRRRGEPVTVSFPPAAVLRLEER
jgi:ABC-type Fe3+/spermidine/putrescine transport system ATPase subunit